MAYTNIDDPSAHFQTVVYTGNNTANNAITNDGNSDLKPDLMFSSYRTAPPYTNHRCLIDSTRGRRGILEPDTTAAEVQSQVGSGNNDLQSFDTDGFTVGLVNSTSSLNAGNTSTVAWQWKANGGTTTSKSSATVSGNVTTPCVQQVNTDAGFSILTYTASTSYAGTETHLEHGLGVGPRFLIVKRRDTAANWAVYHAENGASSNAGYGYLSLNSTAATATSSTYWLNTPAESNATLLAFGNNAATGADGGEYVCYAFAEKQGYSKFGKYVGNGSNTNGSFIYTGFKPAMIIAKRTDASAHNWFIWDTKRAPSNLVQAVLYPNAANAESSLFQIDILSNGFKHYNNYGSTNASGGTYIYMAFAESSFVTSGGIPTTAR